MQLPHFRGVYPASSSLFNNLFVAHNRRVDTYGLAQRLLSKLPSVGYPKGATLINLTVVHHRVSLGYVEDLPSSVIPPQAVLTLTLALDGWLTPTHHIDIRQVTPDSTYWVSSGRFVTIGFTPTELARHGLRLRNLDGFDYLYYTLGYMLKSVFDTRTYGKPVSFLHEPIFYKETLFELPWSSIIQHPFDYWKFNRLFWRNAPNCLNPVIDDLTALFFFTLVHPNLRYPVHTDDGLYRVFYNPSGMLDWLKSSILSGITGTQSHSLIKEYLGINVIRSMWLDFPIDTAMSTIDLEINYNDFKSRVDLSKLIISEQYVKGLLFKQLLMQPVEIR
jgi:hypothetical protein